MSEIIIKNKPEYKFVLENFEGPLDLLLHLITKNKMNIFDISLNELTDEYIKYLDKVSEQNIEIASEFIVMASTLLDIKARKLLPELEENDNDEEDEVSEQDIINRIIEYKKYKEVSNQILDMYNENFGSFIKPVEKIRFEREAVYTGQAIKPQELYEIYSNMIIRNQNKINKNARAIEKIALYEKVTVRDKVNQIVNYLKNNEQMVFNDIYNVNVCDNIEVVTAFLGVLELSKLKQVDVEQNYLFSDINVKQKQDAKFKIDLSGIME